MKISIITVSYNSVDTISDCISSVINQTYKNIEYIIIDGSSTDGTLKILKKNLNYISKLISEPDKGIYDAMNKGLSLAKGDVVGFLNSDDFYLTNNVISEVSEIFKKNKELDACYSDLVLVDRIKTSKIIRYWKSNEFYAGAFSKGWLPAHPTFFVRRNVYESLGYFNLYYRFASDVDLMIRFLEIKKIKFIYVPETWVKFRMGGKSNKNLKNIWLQNQEILQSLKSHKINVNPIYFFLGKFVIKLKQFFQRPHKISKN